MTTQKAFFSYEEVIDLHTEADRVSVIGIHTPIGSTPRQLCPGFFAQFKKYKYLGCKVALVPAATLPADPSQVSYEAGEAPIDPRDMLNPILFHGCHGNDLGNILNRIYSAGAVDGSDLSQIFHSDSTDLWNMFNSPDQDDTLVGTNLLESLYYRALTDKTWKKANVQRGFRIAGLRPRVYSLATNMYLQNASALGTANVAPAPFSGEFGTGEYIDEWKPFADETANPVRYFTPRTVSLGWLDTRSVVGYTPDSRVAVPDAGIDSILKQIVGAGTVDVTLPKIFMGIIMLPPAYKTEMYFRMVISHFFAFAGFRGVSMSNDMLENPNVFDWNEQLSDGDDGGDAPDPDPDPDPDPEPGYDYPAVFLDDGVEPVAGLTHPSRSLSYYRTTDSTTPSVFRFTSSAGSSDVIGVNARNKISVVFTATSGDHSGSKVDIRATSDGLGVEYAVGGVVAGTLANAAAVIDLIAGSLDNSEYFMGYYGQDLYNMFLTENVYVSSDAKGGCKWIKIQAR